MFAAGSLGTCDYELALEPHLASSDLLSIKRCSPVWKPGRHSQPTHTPTPPSWFCYKSNQTLNREVLDPHPHPQLPRERGRGGGRRAGRFRVDLGNLLAQTNFLAPNLLLHKGKLRPREGKSLGMQLGGAPRSRDNSQVTWNKGSQGPPKPLDRNPDLSRTPSPRSHLKTGNEIGRAHV